MDELELAWSFERAMQDRCARSRREFEYGTALFNDELRRVYDTNFVRFERGFEDLTADLVVSLADELQASLGHRKVTIPDEAVGERLAGELHELGWRFSRLVTMAYRGTRERDPERASNARQVTTDEVREARLEALSDGTRDGDAGRQIVAYTEAMAAAAPSRLFAADAGDGSIGAFCELFQRDGTGQIDEVTTIKRYRRHGLGHAVVEAALQASLADRDGLTFLVADDGDWPKEWYGRLGFEPIGRRFELLRT